MLDVKMPVANGPARKRRIVATLMVALLGVQNAMPAFAATLNIAKTPLIVSGAEQAAPNFLFILDDSGSMAADIAGSFALNGNQAGAYNTLCNSLAYNPLVTYAPPPSPVAPFDTMPNANFSAARDDGFHAYTGTGAATRDLATNFKLVGGVDGAARTYRWIRPVPPNVDDCQAELLYATPLYGWEMTSPLPVAQRQNFANWWSYYRNRLNTMKTAAAIAFSDDSIEDRLRVGFKTISPMNAAGTLIDPARFSAVRLFDIAHKERFLAKLYSQPPNTETPLREALSRAGRYFAGKNDGINAGMVTGPADDLDVAPTNLAVNPDPVQFSCQRNAAFLTTDGYWTGPGFRGRRLDGLTNITQGDDDSGSGHYTVTPAPLNGLTWSRTIDQETVIGGYASLAGFYDGCNAGQPTTTTTCTSTTGHTATFTGLKPYISVENRATQQHRGYNVVPGYTPPVPLGVEQFGVPAAPVNNSAQAVVPDTLIVGALGSDGINPPSGANPLRYWKRQGIDNSARPDFDLWWLHGTPAIPSPAPGSGTRTHGTYFVGCVPVTPRCVEYSAGVEGSYYQAPYVTYTFPPFATTNPYSREQTNAPVCNAAGGLPFTGGTSPCNLADIDNPKSNPGETLADVAGYYYQNDLRSAALGNASNGLRSIELNNVPPRGAGPEDDKASHQHMVTYTMGFGVSGRVRFVPDYKTNPASDFQLIRNQTMPWIGPVVGNDFDPAKIDDLWHAAVTGRGQYFSAGDAASVTTAISSAIAEMLSQSATGGSPSSSALRTASGDNYLVSTSFMSGSWNGDVKINVLDLNTGAVGLEVTKASTALNAKVAAACDNRTIFLTRGSNKDSLTWNTSGCAAGALANGSWVATAAADPDWMQLAISSHVPVATGGGWFKSNTGTRLDSDLVNYLRGQFGREKRPAVAAANQRFRSREAGVLGDIVGSQPVYVSAPVFSYTDTGYAQYRTQARAAGGQADRPIMMYVGANDGMLHAFHFNTVAGTLEEKWAMMPSGVVNQLARSGRTNYPTNHRYYMDATPTVGDAFDGTNWRTILVTGYGGGGKGFMAVDVTKGDDATHAAPLWELRGGANCSGAPVLAGVTRDCDVGLSYGNPVIAKVRDASVAGGERWVAILTSGYHEAPGAGGHLFVLDLFTGQLLKKLALPVAGNPDPEVGFAKVAALVADSSASNLVEYVYGGDLIGNVWKFDFTLDLANVAVPTKLAMLTAPNNTKQPVTSAPELVKVGTKRIVYFGTGRYLTSGDPINTQVQSIYALIDDGTARTLARSELDARAYVGVTITGMAGPNTDANGWVLDLPVSGERVFASPKLQLGTLVFPSSAPSADPCTPGGTGYLNYVDALTGLAVPGAPGGVGRTDLPNGGQNVGVLLTQTPSGAVVAITAQSGGALINTTIPVAGGSNVPRRVGWREIHP